MTDLDLDKLEADAKAATPGPWRMEYRDPAMSGRRWVLRRVGAPGIICDAFEYGSHMLAEHIANMNPETALTLIGRVRAAEESLRSIRAIHVKSAYYGGKFCVQCGLLWPCPTIEALGEKS